MSIFNLFQNKRNHPPFNEVIRAFLEDIQKANMNCKKVALRYPQEQTKISKIIQRTNEACLEIEDKRYWNAFIIIRDIYDNRSRHPYCELYEDAYFSGKNVMRYVDNPDFFGVKKSDLG